MNNWFQSAPGLEAGRCFPVWVYRHSGSEFQSAPGLEAGRCADMAGLIIAGNVFQSAPGLEAGRCGVRLVEGEFQVLVSIRARP